MPTTYNRQAFHFAVAHANCPPLLKTYCGLMLVELALKDQLGPTSLRHNIPDMLQRLGRIERSSRAALNHYRAMLSNNLTILRVQTALGAAGYARAAVFPDIRYIRHHSDWNHDASSDAEINDLRICVDRLRHFLRSNIGLPQPV